MKDKLFTRVWDKFASIFWLIEFHFFNIYNKYFNEISRKQHNNIFSIPIIIISFNNLSGLKKLLEFLRKRNFVRIIIIDNKSSYKPLLNYYSQIENEFEIIYNKTNQGHMVFWNNKKILNRFKNGYYVVTDADILPDKDCPNDFLAYFKKKLDANSTITKVGFSLKIDDIPETNIHKNKILNWESRFWEKKDKNGDFFADIDTTFAIYRPINQFNIKYFYKAIRAKKTLFS